LIDNSNLLLRCKKKCLNEKIKLKRFCKKCLNLEEKKENKKFRGGVNRIYYYLIQIYLIIMKLII